MARYKMFDNKDYVKYSAFIGGFVAWLHRVSTQCKTLFIWQPPRAIGSVERYQAGATPVREAMLRLVGEGLLTMPPQGGFEVPSVDEVMVGHFYETMLGKMLDAVARRAGASLPLPLMDSAATDQLPPIERLFDHLAARTGNPFFLGEVRRLNDHMRRIRRAEEKSLSGLSDEFAALVAQVERDEHAAIRRSIAAYHRRRLRHLGQIVAAISPKLRT